MVGGGGAGEGGGRGFARRLTRTEAGCSPGLTGYHPRVPGRFLYYSEVLLRLMPEQDYAVRLEALAEALPLEVAATDREGRVVVWNEALARVAGPRARAVGRPLLEAMPSLLADRNVDWAATLADALAGRPGRTLRATPSARGWSGRRWPPCGEGRGEVLGAVLCFEDMTHVAREEERRRLQTRSDAVTALGAGIAHEVRNPLNALSLNLQLLRERLADPGVSREDLARRTEMILAEVARMETLVQNLLEVSRGGPPVCEDLPLDEIVRAVAERLEEAARARGVRLHLAPGSRRLLPLERTRIERAIQNIVRNAIEATPAGGNVWVVTRDDPHSTVVVVDDDGPGIRPEDRARVFELFWTRKRGGTGLGLPLAKRAVESHGGELEVLERPGGGARFVIHLPIREGRDVREGEGGETWRAS